MKYLRNVVKNRFEYRSSEIFTRIGMLFIRQDRLNQSMFPKNKGLEDKIVKSV